MLISFFYALSFQFLSLFWTFLLLYLNLRLFEATILYRNGS